MSSFGIFGVYDALDQRNLIGQYHVGFRRRNYLETYSTYVSSALELELSSVFLFGLVKNLLHERFPIDRTLYTL